MTQDDRPEHEGGSGAGSAAGQPVDDSSKSQPQSPPAGGDIREVPIGYPVSDEEFKKHKDQAERPAKEDEPEG
jgi:hypothetical protein